ncbi:immunoglobulin domain-containing protein, partial [Mucilaginibacter frigoritolerans]
MLLKNNYFIFLKSIFVALLLIFAINGAKAAFSISVPACAVAGSDLPGGTTGGVGNGTYIGLTNSTVGTHTITLTVYPSAPTVANVSSCGGGPVTITASGGSPSGGNYVWYAASTGGTALQDSTLTTYTPIVYTTTTFYVTYS